MPAATIAKIAATVLLLALVFLKLDFSASISLLFQLSAAAICFGLFCLIVQAFLISLRLSLITSMFAANVGFFAASRMTLQSMFFNQAFTSFIGGDGWRIYRLHRCGMSLPAAAGAVTLDRIIGLISNHVVLLMLLPWSLYRIEDQAVRWALIMIAAGGIFGIAVFFVLAIFARRRELVSWLPDVIAKNRVARIVADLATAGRHLFASPGASSRVWLISIPVVLCNMAVFFVVLLGLGVAPDTALDCTLLVPAIMEIVLMPVSIAGWGIREGAAVAGFAAIGLRADIALAASLAFGLLSLAMGLIGGIAFISGKKQYETPTNEPA